MDSSSSRGSARVAMGDVRVECVRDDGHKIRTRVIDISTGGALLEGPVPLRLGERCAIRLGDLEMRASAVSVVGSHVGVRFEGVDPVAYAAIERRVNDAVKSLGDVEIPDGKGGRRRLPAHLLQLQSVYETLAMPPSSSSSVLRAAGEAALAAAKESATPQALRELERLRRVWTEPGVRLDHDVRFGLLTIDAARAPRALPKRIGRYRVVEHRASGGTADVFVAVERTGIARDRLVAVKRILPHFANSAPYLDMFVDEAYWVSRIQHPNVVQIYEIGEHDGSPFLALEYVAGYTLRHLVVEAARKKVRLSVEACVAAIVQACAGLHAAHELKDAGGAGAGLVHRDVSPQNLMATMDGAVKVLDFGIARATAIPDALDVKPEGHGLAKRHASYLAPEQIRREPVDRRADVFALGVVAWELLVERRILARGSEFQLMEANLRGDRPKLRALRPELPEGIAAAIERALVVDRDARTPSADALRKELLAAAAAAGLSVDAKALASAMEHIFGDRDRERRQNLASAQAALDDKAPAAEVMRGVRGSLSDLSLAEIVQSLDLSNRSAEIQVSVDGVAVGLIAIESRSVVTSVFGALRGPPAFLALLSVRDGQFLLRHQTPRAEHRNMSAPTELMLLEAMRASDEGTLPSPSSLVVEPLARAMSLDAGLEDTAELVARLLEAARVAKLEAELATEHAKSVQAELEALREKSSSSSSS